MGLRLPKNGYGAMVLINQLANHGLIAGVGYQTIKEEGRVKLVAIRAQIAKPLDIDNPEVIGLSESNLIKLPANVG